MALPEGGNADLHGSLLLSKHLLMPAQLPAGDADVVATRGNIWVWLPEGGNADLHGSLLLSKHLLMPAQVPEAVADVVATRGNEWVALPVGGNADLHGSCFHVRVWREEFVLGG